MDKELRNFANAARQLGSSVAILSSAFHLRERLAQIIYLYRQNAADLFPRKITHLPRYNAVDSRAQTKRRSRWMIAQTKAPPHVARPTVTENLDLEFFPQQLEALSADVTTFLKCLNEFPEFTDEAVNASITSFEEDLKYWAACLNEYAGHFRYPSVQRYVHDLSTEMGEHIDNITSTLSMFIEVGIPTIRFAQEHGANNLLNLSTVATFFSAVTATTLQSSYRLERTPLGDSVNCFWFASMVFSIAAAVNSLLGVTWKQAMYRSPGHRVPWWVLIWIKRSPLVFLVMSVACFSIGLCLFTYASGQSQVTSTLTTVFTAFTSFGLVAVSAWFASERWIFLRHRGQKWLSDALMEYGDMLMSLPGVEPTRQGFRAVGRLLKQTHKYLCRISSKALRLHTKNSIAGQDLEANIPPVTHAQNERPFVVHRISDGEKSIMSSDSHKALSIPVLSLQSDKPSDIPQTPATPGSPGKQLWRHAIQSVKMHSAVSAAPSGVVVSPHGSYRQRTTSSNLTAGDKKRTNPSGETARVLFISRVATLVPKLRVLETTQDLAAHQALVRRLQFSPDGKYLATSSWDKTSVIFRVGDPFTCHRILAHAQNFVGQVAWSPLGNTLLTKLNRGIKVWTSEDGVCKKTIERQAFVESIQWFPDGKCFISVEGSDVIKLDLSGNILDQYNFGSMKLHDVAVTPDGLRLIGVGPLLASPNGLQPSKSRAEKRLVVYNTRKREIENRTPVLNDVRHITVVQTIRSGVVALISYENTAPPQLWKLDLVKDRGTSTLHARLTLRHTYLPKFPVDFAGPSSFGGKNNELILCAGKAGDIHIWDQESGALLHHVPAQANGGDLTCIAWNHASEDPFMFATGSHDGAVRIWTKRPEEQSDEDLADHERGITGTDILRTNSPFELLEHERRSENLLM